MKTNVTTLLREFPRVRRAAFRGEEVVVVTREGNLRITADPVDGKSVIGSMKDVITSCDDAVAEPTTSNSEWESSL